MLEISDKVTIEDILDLISRVPEFESKHRKEDFITRFADRKHQLLVAYLNGEKAGFKVGYDRYQDGSFYSWLGAVLPEFRRKHIARKLAYEQEVWAKEEGFNRVIIKTKNKFSAMLIFLLKSGFKITKLELANNTDDNTIKLEKDI